jgi:hypothetical protein
MAYEDFTTFTEVDPGGWVTVTASRCNVVNADTDLLYYVRADRGAGHFGDFERLLTFHLGSGSKNSRGGTWGVSNGASAYVDMAGANDGIAHFVARYSTGAYNNSFIDFTNDNSDSFTPTINTTYYFTFKRAGTTFTCKVYSDAARTNLLDTLSFVCGTTTYRYIYGIVGWHDTPHGGADLDYYSENLSLQEASTPASYAFIM